MDEKVLQAMQRWPDVPAAYGWLSLNARGQWRLHPKGDWDDLATGEPIGNTDIVAFMNRNYAATPDGQWHFQNGPQRVFVKLERAPYILSLSGQPIALRAHTGQTVQRIDGWWIDSQGNLYAQTDLGPAAMDGHDLETITEILQTEDGQTLADWWLDHAGTAAQTRVRAHADGPLAILNTEVPLVSVEAQTNMADVLGFVSIPVPATNP